MATSDPIADMLTRIRNAVHAGHKTVNIKRSGACLGIAAVLRDQGYIRDFDSIDDSGQGLIRVHLKYGEDGEQIIVGLARVSKPGRRVYFGYQDIEPVLDGMGIAVVSTNKGMMTDSQCREQKVGGEVLCNVW
jgi:small subunit ribosomal protein S8